MAKNTPAWKMLGLAECPPVDEHGYVSYGRVYCVQTHGRPGFREVWRDELRWAWHSYRLWGRKIIKQIRWEITRRREIRAGG